MLELKNRIVELTTQLHATCAQYDAEIARRVHGTNRSYTKALDVVNGIDDMRRLDETLQQQVAGAEHVASIKAKLSDDELQAVGLAK